MSLARAVKRMVGSDLCWGVGLGVVIAAGLIGWGVMMMRLGGVFLTL